MMNSNKYIPILATKIIPELKKLGASGNACFNKISLHAMYPSEEIFI
jgi:hypothetical protein